jgi:hypothetical protein
MKQKRTYNHRRARRLLLYYITVRVAHGRHAAAFAVSPRTAPLTEHKSNVEATSL